MAGVRYVGAGVLASAVEHGQGLHEDRARRPPGCPCCRRSRSPRREWRADPAACRRAVAALGYPLFVKPARGGSSIGISKVHDAAELDAAIEEARRHDPKVLVEVAAEGAREVECGVLQALDGNPETSVPAEIRIGGEHEFYDFAAKYLPEEHTELDVPADLPDEVAARMRELAVRAFEARGLRGAGARRLLRDARRLAGRQRDQHDARLHADVDVPADVGGLRAGLPGPGRPARSSSRWHATPACAEPDPASGGSDAGSTRRSCCVTAGARSTSVGGRPSGR